VEVAGGHTFRQISTSNYHTCAVTTDDRAYCWGDNTFGQVGDGTTGDGSTVLRRLVPTAVTGGLRFREVSAGEAFTCGLSAADNRAYCWGTNIEGQLGDETLDARARPTKVHGGHHFLQLAAGNSHVCAVRTDQRGFCWGRGAEGQLGVGVFDIISHGMKPRAVVGGLSFRQFTTGGLHSCGVTTSDIAYCWGYNQKGQLGDGTQVSRAKPVKVVGGT
jgi:alpha-tubulin suppressor-like RCC1 family protein